MCVQYQKLLAEIQKTKYICERSNTYIVIEDTRINIFAKYMEYMHLSADLKA